MEARRTAGLNNAPPCSWFSTPPLELKEVPAEALSANAGFVSFGKLRKQLFVEFVSFMFVVFNLKICDVSMQLYCPVM